MEMVSFPNRERRENIDEGNPTWVTYEGFEELRRQWRKKLVDVFEKAFGLRLMLARSPVEYLYDFPGYLDDYKASFMESADLRMDQESSKVCLCLRPAISSRPRSSRSPRAKAVTIIPALVLLL
jgi:hypothetical protein